jgi:hypothetical protein
MTLKILEGNTSENILYDSWLKDFYKVFSKFTDDDFFSDKVSHIYFYSIIDENSVNNLHKNLI